MTTEKSILHARHIVEAFDGLLSQLDSNATIDYAALLGALEELKQRYEWQRLRSWDAAMRPAITNAQAQQDWYESQRSDT